MIIHLRRNKCIPVNKLGMSNVITDIPNIIGKVYHPTEKPIDLFSRLILQSSKENEIVFDPFSGAGSCALSCIENNRRCISIEQDPTYFDTMVNRIEGNV